MEKALVLLSGGIDSAVSLWWAKERGWRLATLSFDFPGRRRGEIRAVRALRRLAGCRENFDVELPFLKRPRAEEACYIPHRNLMYYGTAASVASRIGARCIIGGHIRHDGAVFADARKSYFRSLERLIRTGRREKRPPSLLFPFIASAKREVIRAGARLGVPFRATWSCSRNGERPCRLCGSCRERSEGFRSARFPDPLFAGEAL